VEGDRALLRNIQRTRNGWVERERGDEQAAKNKPAERIERDRVERTPAQGRFAMCESTIRAMRELEERKPQRRV